MKKPTYTYLFENEVNAESFFRAIAYTNISSNVQYPISNGIPNKKQVMVTGTGSLNFDMVLRNKLEETAEDFRGVLLR